MNRQANRQKGWQERKNSPLQIPQPAAVMQRLLLVKPWLHAHGVDYIPAVVSHSRRHHRLVLPVGK